MMSSSLHLILPPVAALTAMVALFLARTAWRKRPAPGAVELAWLTIAVAVWSGGMAFTFSVPDLATRLLGVKIAYFGVVAAPPLTLLFVLTYTGFSRRLDRRTLVRVRPLLLIVPVISLVLAWTYPWNRLTWANVVSDPQGYMPIPTYGPYKYLELPYHWLLMMSAALVMSWYAFSVRGVYRRMALLVAATLLIPLVPNLLYLLRLPALSAVDLTFLGMLAAVTILLYAVRRGSFLDVRPIAHDVLMDRMSDAILVIDAGLRVVDCNRAALVDLGLARLPLGRPLPEVLNGVLGPGETAGLAGDSVTEAPGGASEHQWSVSGLLQALQQEDESSGDLVVARPHLRHFHWRISPLGRTDNLPAAGWILVWRDVTQERLRLAMLYEQERALRHLVERQHRDDRRTEQARTVLAGAYDQGLGALAAIKRGDLAVAAASLSRFLTVVDRWHGEAGLALVAEPVGESAEESFLGALDSFLDEYGRSIGATVEFSYADAKIPALLSPWMRVQLVRLIQQGLEAIQQRASIQHLHVSLSADTDWVVMQLSIACGTVALEAGADETVEMTQASAELCRLWLEQESMQQRLAAAGGQMACEPMAAAGCRVAFRLPRLLPRRTAQLRQQQVLLATAQPALASQLGALLEAQAVPVVGTVHDAESLLVQARAARPQLILVEVALLQDHQAAGLQRLRRSAPDAKIVVLLASAGGEAAPGEAVRNGADGYLQVDREMEHLVAELADLLSGDPPLAAHLASELLESAVPPGMAPKPIDALRIGLTDRQIEVLTLIVRGYTYQEIAVQLYVAERTVRRDALEIRQRMGVASRAAMIEFAIQHNLVAPGHLVVPS